MVISGRGDFLTRVDARLWRSTLRAVPRPRVNRPQQVPWPDLAQGQAERLRRTREAKGWSLRDLAAAAGVTTRTIGAIESGAKGETSCAVVAALADALGVPRGWLAFGG